MSNLSQFTGANRAPVSIVNIFSANGYTAYNSSGVSPIDVKSILSGALTANTLATLLAISGPGMLQVLAIRTMDATARTMRLQVTIDGVIVFDSTSATVSAAGWSGLAVGGFLSNYSSEMCPFNSSLVVKVASSLSETDKLEILTKYYTY